MGALTLTSGQVATALGYLHRNGQPHRARIYRLARQGQIPGPIDAQMRSIDWRWSPAEIEAYCAGQWQKPTTLRRRSA